MDVLALALLIVAGILFGIEAVRSRSLIAAGLCSWVIAILIPAL
jgi:hypothetical protein